MKEYTFKDSFEFANDIINQSLNYFVALLDVKSLFTDVSFEWSIKICIDELFRSEIRVSALSKKEMFELLSSFLKESIIWLDNKYYSQIDGFTKSSPLETTLGNIFLCYYESNWLKDCPKDFKKCGWFYLFRLINKYIRRFLLNILIKKIGTWNFQLRLK